MALRLTASLAAILFLSSAAHAGVAEELTAAINNCAAMTDDATRHACYDRLPQLLKTLPPDVAPVAAAAPVAALPNAARAAEDSSGGSFSLFGAETIPADHVTAAVESFTYDYGVFVVTLDNGQVWRQISTQTGHAPFSKEKKDKVIIWHGAFGDDKLKIEGYPATYRVRRVQ